MISPLVNYKEWEKRYRLQSEDRPCCGKLLKKVIPFAYGDIRGLRSADHGCGPQFNHSISRSVNEKDLEIINNAFKHLRKL